MTLVYLDHPLNIVQLLKKINFSFEDELYILGDVVDRGPEPISIAGYDAATECGVYPW